MFFFMSMSCKDNIVLKISFYLIQNMIDKYKKQITAH